jgi:GNAT superfamily N-acetyltransferase
VTLVIRPARPADAASIGELHAKSWIETFGNVLSDEYRSGAIFEDRESIWRKRLSAPAANQFVIVAEEDGRLAAFACAYGADDERWGTLLDNLHVHSAWQGRGLGKSLLIGVADWCAAEYPEVGLYLVVLEQNSRARAFYGKLGAADVGGETWVPPGFLEAPSRRYAWAPERVVSIRRLAGEARG